MDDRAGTWGRLRFNRRPPVCADEIPPCPRPLVSAMTPGTRSDVAGPDGRHASDNTRLIQDRVRSQTRAFVFDLDGVIAWTEPFHHAALNAFLADFGCALSPDQFKQLVGKDNSTVANLLTQWFSLPMSTEQLTEGRHKKVLPLLIRDLKPAPGLLPLLRFLDDRRMSLAIASNSPRDYVEDVIGLLGLSDRFPCVRTGEDVAHGKPAPDVYLSASECLGIPAEQCLSVEDSPSGVRSAMASGMISVLVPNGLLQGEDFPRADLSFASLADLLAWLRSVFQPDTSG